MKSFYVAVGNDKLVIEIEDHLAQELFYKVLMLASEVGSKSTHSTPTTRKADEPYAHQVEENHNPQRLILVKCPHCGKTTFLNSKESEQFNCKCGHSFHLEKLTEAQSKCGCGNAINYLTNDRTLTHITCKDCGSKLVIYHK